MLQLSFNPGLMLTGCRTTRPRCYKLGRVLSGWRPCTIHKQGVCVLTKWWEHVVLDECYFLSIKECYHWSLLLWHLVAPKRAIFWLCWCTYWSRSKSIAFMRSAIFSCCSAIFLWSFSSFECLMTFSGTLAMKFWSKRTTIFSRFTSLLLLCAGVSSNSTSLNACEIDASSSLSYSIVSCHTRK